MDEKLKLGNQFCFPIYSLAKELIALYRPVLDELDLTYPQYLVMMVLWERREQTVSQISEVLSLDNSTVTPILKRLEQKALIERKRSKDDERVVFVSIAPAGQALEEKAIVVPQKIFESLQVPVEDLLELKSLIVRIMSQIKK